MCLLPYCTLLHLHQKGDERFAFVPESLYEKIIEGDRYHTFAVICKHLCVNVENVATLQ